MLRVRVLGMNRFGIPLKEANSGMVFFISHSLLSSSKKGGNKKGEKERRWGGGTCWKDLQELAKDKNKGTFFFLLSILVGELSQPKKKR